MKKLAEVRINIEGKGKTKEQIQQEIIDEVIKKTNEVIDKEINKELPLAKLHITCDEDPDRNGFMCSKTIEGTGEQIFIMLVNAVQETLAMISNKEADDQAEVDLELLRNFVEALTIKCIERGE